jgi:hypothetical protein
MPKLLNQSQISNLFLLINNFLRYLLLVHFEADPKNLFSCGKEHYEKKEDTPEPI